MCNYYQFKFLNTNKLITIARSGNVIGGGDFSKDRIFPDIYRSIKHNQNLQIRKLQSVRPWQHVLEPLFGYIKTVEFSFKKKIKPDVFNYGPNYQKILSVKSILNLVKLEYPSLKYEVVKTNFYESNYLSLNSSKIKKKINYSQVWNIKKTVNKTIRWYLEYINKKSAIKLCLEDINEYKQDLLK